MIYGTHSQFTAINVSQGVLISCHDYSIHSLIRKKSFCFYNKQWNQCLEKKLFSSFYSFEFDTFLVLCKFLGQLEWLWSKMVPTIYKKCLESLAKAFNFFLFKLQHENAEWTTSWKKFLLSSYIMRFLHWDISAPISFHIMSSYKMLQKMLPF